MLHKLRQFQDAGHTAVLIVGDFTAQVGDPSGKTETRPRLSAGGGRGYAERLLDQFWTDPRSRAHRGPVQRRVARADEHGGDPAACRRRPPSRGCSSATTSPSATPRASRSRSWSSSTRCSRGWTRSRSRPTSSSAAGTRRSTCSSAGTCSATFEQEPQVALTTPLLVGTDGVQKMSQSLGNYVGITDPPDEMFGKLVRIPDELIPTYRLPRARLLPRPHGGRARRDGPGGRIARRVGREAPARARGRRPVPRAGGGAGAEERFDRVHRERELPEEVPDLAIPLDLVIDGRVYLPEAPGRPRPRRLELARAAADRTGRRPARRAARGWRTRSSCPPTSSRVGCSRWVDEDSRGSDSARAARPLASPTALDAPPGRRVADPCSFRSTAIGPRRDGFLLSSCLAGGVRGRVMGLG